jgi:hypothetical protein
MRYMCKFVWELSLQPIGVTLLANDNKLPIVKVSVQTTTATKLATDFSNGPPHPLHEDLLLY